MTEKEIYDYYDNIYAQYGGDLASLSDYLFAEALKLRYDELPEEAKKRADALPEERFFDFITTSAKMSVDTYDNQTKIIERAAAEYGEGSAYYQIQKAAIESKQNGFAPPSSIIRRAASMRSTTFHAHYDDYKHAVLFTVEAPFDHSIGAKARRTLRVNVSLVDAMDALKVIYHPQRESVKDKQRNAGVITHIPKNISLPIVPEFQNALSMNQQGKAGIVGVPMGDDNKPINISALFDDQGKATEEGVRVLERSNKGVFTPFQGDMSFIKTMYTVANDQYMSNPDSIKGKIRISRAALCDHLGIRYSDRRRVNSTEIAGKPIDTITEVGQFIDDVDRRIVENYKACRDVVGFMPDGSWYYLLVFFGYEAKTDSYIVALPYPAALAEAINKSKIETATGRKRFNPHYGHNDLIHGTMYKCKNEPAKGIVEYLLATMTLQSDRGQEGEAGSKRVVHEVSCATIVDSVPTLSSRIAESTRAADQNRILKRAFEGVITQTANGKRTNDLFAKYTDAYTYFTDLQITWKIPTMDTLRSTKILITWKPRKEAASVAEAPRAKKRGRNK